jgi:hypothetical protein
MSRNSLFISPSFFSDIFQLYNTLIACWKELNIIKDESVWECSSVVQWLLSIHKGLGLISSTTKKKKSERSWAWWLVCIIPALRRLRQEDCDSKLHSDTLSQKKQKMMMREQRIRFWLSFWPVKMDVFALTCQINSQSPTRETFRTWAPSTRDLSTWQCFLLNVLHCNCRSSASRKLLYTRHGSEHL